MVEFANLNYFIAIIFTILLIIILYQTIKNKSDKTKNKVILILLFSNLLLHFSKILFEPYISGLPHTLRKITFENICAVTTLIYPFVYLTKNKYLNTYLFFISLIGGLFAVCYPMEVIGKKMWSFDTLRFYFCHIVLLIVPILLACLHLFKPRYKDFWVIPIGFIIISTLIFINEIILIKIGWVNSSYNDFFDRNIRNTSFVFGPLPAFDKLNWLFEIVTPKFLRYDYFNTNLDIVYFPVLWLVIPSFIFLPIIYAIILLPFNIKSIILRKE